MCKRTCLYLLLITAVIHGQSLAAEPRYDFRVVIDVSGSMKQTDPQNLRVPALKLINGLIPTGSRAGVWTFGRYVNMAVKWSKVDDAWRNELSVAKDQLSDLISEFGDMFGGGKDHHFALHEIVEMINAIKADQVRSQPVKVQK